MAVTEEKCRDMIRASDQANVRLMVAYRLHFDAANLAAVEAVEHGRIGDPRVFGSVFTIRRPGISEPQTVHVTPPGGE